METEDLRKRQALREQLREGASLGSSGGLPGTNGVPRTQTFNAKPGRKVPGTLRQHVTLFAQGHTSDN